MKEKFDIGQFEPCREALAYYAGKPTFEAAWNECGRGDWMLWIAQKLGVDDRTMTRAKALCANTVRHLMKDSRSTDAIDAALRYADGKITREQLDRYDRDALAAVDSATAYADSYTDAYVRSLAAAYARTYTYAAAAYAAVSAATYAATYAAAVKKKNLLETARICQEVLTDAVFKKVKELKIYKVEF
jgi:hypothetical protein